MQSKEYLDKITTIVQLWFYSTFFGAMYIESLNNTGTHYVVSVFAFTMFVILGSFVVWKFLCFCEWCYLKIKRLLKRS